jgi:hypothetical protein
MKYLLPGTSHLICKDALSVLIGFGQFAWNKVSEMAKNNSSPRHGNKGRQSHKVDLEVQAHLKSFFDTLSKQAQPRATQLVRDLVRETVRTKIRNGGEELLDLPTYLTKRSIYGKLLHERGCWIRTPKRLTQPLSPSPPSPSRCRQKAIGHAIQSVIVKK